MHVRRSEEIRDGAVILKGFEEEEEAEHPRLENRAVINGF